MALDFNSLFGMQKGGGQMPAPAASLSGPKPPAAKPHALDPGTGEAPLGTFDDADLLSLWEKIKKESLDDSWIFERQWHRNILYTLGRQWIEYFARQGGWKDKRMAPWIPRPVTNKCKETVQAIRAMFTSIKLGVNVRPNGSEPENVSAAATADDMHPLLHEDHNMDGVLEEADFWLIVTGNSFIHTFLDYDMKYGVLSIPQMQCADCGNTFDQPQQAMCPECQSPNIGPAMVEDGSPMPPRQQPKGKPVTIPLSPLELAFPNTYARFDEVPYVVRRRWRTKTYYQNHPVLKDLVEGMSWSKSPNDHSLQLFKSLASHNDLGVSPAYLGESGTTSNDTTEGISEYEVWYKPCDAYPDGLVFRVVGDKAPQILHIEDEALPGPLPYKDAGGRPLFTFSHAGYDHVGGRILASGPLDLIIQKQDMLNQLDSHILLIVQRMSNPVWLEPKGAEVERITGMPGLVIKWNPLSVQGSNAKPERIDGIGVNPSLFQVREGYLKDIEELAGTFDIIKGAKPSGVEAFSALQLLVERSQSRFANVFGSRGKMYRDWFKFAIELEREFGESERVKAVLTPARTWTFQNFKRANLQGAVSVIIEDGTMAPKTSLGMRAALEHANQLGMLDMKDPDQRYEGLKLFGITRMVPSLDIHVQSALQKQQAFEQWANDPQAQQQTSMEADKAFADYETKLQAVQAEPVPPVDPMNPQAPAPMPLPELPKPPSIANFTPLKWHAWYDPQIHRQEFLKWANGDKARELLMANPALDQILEAHLADIMAALAEQAQALQAAMNPPQVNVGVQTATSGAMKNSNTQSGKTEAGQHQQTAQKPGNA